MVGHEVLLECMRKKAIAAHTICFVSYIYIICKYVCIHILYAILHHGQKPNIYCITNKRLDSLSIHKLIVIIYCVIYLSFLSYHFAPFVVQFTGSVLNTHINSTCTTLTSVSQSIM